MIIETTHENPLYYQLHFMLLVLLASFNVNSFALTLTADVDRQAISVTESFT